MSARVRLGLLLAATLAGCAEVPAPPVEAPGAGARVTTVVPRAAPGSPLAPTIDAWRQRALQHKASGDLASAATDWHVLTLLAPDEPVYRRELAATRAAIRAEVTESLQTAHAALRSGDNERASSALLRVLALDPENDEAARGLRDVEKHKLGRIQADRAAKVRQEEAPATAAAPRNGAKVAAEAASAYDIEQRLAMFNAGDVAGGLRELRAWVDANPQDRAGRQRIGAAVFDRGRELETQGSREQALNLYDAAVAMRGDAAPGWQARIQALRKTLSNDYYDRGTRAERTDLAAAIQALEASVRYDPANVKAATRLAQARLAQARLREIEKAPAK